MNRAILAVCFAMLAMQAHAETPRQFAERFYRGYFRWQIRGVPTPVECNRISPFFTSEIIRLFTTANQQRAEFDRRFPFDPKNPTKGGWNGEGDFFAGSWEGISTFAIGRAVRIRGHIAVHTHLEWVSPAGKSTPWTNVLVLDRAGDDWVVADILFPHGDRLVAGMKKNIAEVDQSLRKSPK